MVTVMDMASGQLIAGERDDCGDAPVNAASAEWLRVELRLQEVMGDRDARLHEAACCAAWLHAGR